MSWAPETKVRTSLVHIIHQADFLAARVEFERQWFSKFNSSEESSKVEKPTKKLTVKSKALVNIKSEGLKSAMSDFFND
jgi:hypothetical protein